MKAIIRKNGSDISVEGEPLVGCPCMPAQWPKAERQEGMENIFFQGSERVARILISLNKPSQWQRVGLFVILDKFALGKPGNFGLDRGMNFFAKLCTRILLVALPALLVFADESSFKHSVTTEKKPWTAKKFLNDPADFQFAIVSDRTGGPREGIFPKAVSKINELRPEFVITVGDMIQGGRGNRDVKKLKGQWKEFNSFIEGFDMPFFYLPGNHDVGNEVADQIWDEMYGVRYYSFTYKNVLFLCLNTQGGPGTKPALLQDEQIKWALAELKKTAEVRWTLVFMHQPLWLMEEGILIHKEGKKELRKTQTGWPKIAEELKGRKHTVFAGHVHHYGKYPRNGTSFYTLGTTGGGSKLRGWLSANSIMGPGSP